ncbi:putative calcium-binding protein CML18 [Sesamum alatum]|uniref:Calcium-binding protein CML18 n=1 Tax=Sesamum alatum TaxID=300844 RepID=A0AAE1XW84_9LAMI|nr:putative calcium-binding protein CML18 [Sesamum alatum]
MLDSVKLCLSSQFKKVSFLRSWKRRKTKKLSSAHDLSWLASSMEVSSQLKQVFKLIDTNGDGKLSPLELQQVLLSLGHDEKANAAEEAQGIVREMDFDGDGFVDFDEFLIGIGTDQNQDSANGICRESEIMEAFRVFDADNNGLISAEELKSVLGRLGCGKCSIKECRKMIRGVDRDGDGFVSFEEFKCMMNA